MAGKKKNLEEADENKEINSQKSSGDAWYTEAGTNEDVVLSHRVRFARNLANFPFPGKLNQQDSERVMSIIFDSFNRLPDGAAYQTVSVSHLDVLGKNILMERGILTSPEMNESGIIVRNDGKISCTVNAVDHIRLAGFGSGLAMDDTYVRLKELDDSLQKYMQFAASYDFGYLTSNLQDAGSGMKISARMHLPCLSFTGQILRINEIVTSRNGEFKNCFGAGQQAAALGAYYEISTHNRLNGSEKDQELSFASLCCDLLMLERAAREEASRNLKTTIQNIVYRALALSRYSLFMSSREAIDIISGIKLGKNLNLLKGITDTELNALLFRIQDGHLEYVMKNGNFSFEDEVEKDDQKKKHRLRSTILQEAFEKTELV